MFIEKIFMRYGHSTGGIIGITLKPDALKVWALSRHLCCSIESRLNEMEEEEDDKHQTTHKEEGRARIKADAKVREGIHHRSEHCIHPLDPEQHKEGIVNISTGEIGSTKVNVQNALKIGEDMLMEFEKC